MARSQEIAAKDSGGAIWDSSDNSKNSDSAFIQSLKEDVENSLKQNENYKDSQVNIPPAAASDCYKEDYFLMWHKNHHGSIDLGLDEKLTSMTGSYSEILDDSRNDVLKTEAIEAALNNTNEFSSMSDPTVNKETVTGDPQTACLSKDGLKGSEMQASKNPWGGAMEDYGVSAISRDLLEKGNLSGQSRRKECLLRNMSSSQNVPRSLLYPTIPPVDPSIIADLEDQARHIATSMDTLIENLTGTLHSISALSVGCVETYRDAVCKTCDAVDSNIKSMYQLMAKCEELSKSMKPVYKLHDQIKEIKRLLDLFESSVYSGGT